jgi:hypothetical protein
MLGKALVSQSHRYQLGKLTAKLHVHSRDWLVRRPYRDMECIWQNRQSCERDLGNLTETRRQAPEFRGVSPGALDLGLCVWCSRQVPDKETCFRMHCAELSNGTNSWHEVLQKL